MSLSSPLTVTVFASAPKNHRKMFKRFSLVAGVVGAGFVSSPAAGLRLTRDNQLATRNEEWKKKTTEQATRREERRRDAALREEESTAAGHADVSRANGSTRVAGCPLGRRRKRLSSISEGWTLGPINNTNYMKEKMAANQHLPRPSRPSTPQASNQNPRKSMLESRIGEGCARPEPPAERAGGSACGFVPPSAIRN